MTSAAIDLTRALAIPGWMEADELRWLADRARQSAIVIEVGSWKGRSTRALADHCAGVVYAIDSWNGPCLREDGSAHPLVTEVSLDFARNLRDHLDTGRVIAAQEPSRTALARLQAELGPVADLVFIDGDHRYQACVEDIAAALLLLRPGGVVAGHDFTNAQWPGVARAVTERFGQAFHRAGKTIWWVQP